MKKKKTVIIISIIIVLLVLFFPVRMNLKDGGSVRYKALLYEVTKIHQLNHNVDGVKPYIDGIEIKILGMTVYRKTDDELKHIVEKDEFTNDTAIQSSVSKIGKGTLSQAVDISAEDATSLTEIIKSGNWIRDNSKCEHDCVMTLSGYSVHYHSECGTLEKINLSEVSTYSSKEPSTNSMLILDEQTKDKVNAILEKYIDLENE